MGIGTNKIFFSDSAINPKATGAHEGNRCEPILQHDRYQRHRWQNQTLQASPCRLRFASGWNALLSAASRSIIRTTGTIILKNSILLQFIVANRLLIIHFLLYGKRSKQTPKG